MLAQVILDPSNYRPIGNLIDITTAVELEGQLKSTQKQLAAKWEDNESLMFNFVIILEVGCRGLFFGHSFRSS